MKNIYNDKYGLAYAIPLWGTGLGGLNLLIAGLFLFHTKLILIGVCATVFILRKDILYFARSDRFFLVTLLIQIVIGSILIGIGISKNDYQPFLVSNAITLIWTLFFSFYLFKKLDWND